MDHVYEERVEGDEGMLPEPTFKKGLVGFPGGSVVKNKQKNLPASADLFFVSQFVGRWRLGIHVLGSL